MLRFKRIKSKLSGTTLHYLFETWFLIFCFICIPVAQATDMKNQKNEKKEMATLVIDLQDGFLDETVMIQVDGKKIFHKKGVNTDYAIGRADSVKVQIPNGSVKIVVNALSKNLSNILLLDVSTNVYLGISLLDDRISFRASKEVFLYY